jgi:hypothetical protein
MNARSEAAPSNRRGNYRKASEIGAFLYCQRAWWLRHGLGLPIGNVEARARGEAAHDRMGRQLHGAAATRRLALLLTAVAIVLLAWSFLLR